MSEPGETSDNRRPARPATVAAALVLLTCLVALAVVVAFGNTDPPRRAGPSDLDTYERVVSALRAGQGYYAALHEALLAGGYGTLSPLNWRTPAFLTLLSSFPSLAAAHLALGAMIAAAGALAVGFVYRSAGLGAAFAAGLLLAASLFGIVGARAELSFELCAGALILASVSANGLGWRWAAIGFGVLALFVRELAGLYVLALTGSAVLERRWREVGVWLAAGIAYAASYGMHIVAVEAELGPADHAAAADWLQWGGLPFVLRTAAFNGIFLALPVWVSAALLPLGILGWTAAPRSVRTQALAFLLLCLALFLVYGRPENDYWGAIYTPVLTLGLVWLPRAVRALTQPRSFAAGSGGGLRSGS